MVCDAMNADVRCCVPRDTSSSEPQLWLSSCESGRIAELCWDCPITSSLSLSGTTLHASLCVATSGAWPRPNPCPGSGECAMVTTMCLPHITPGTHASPAAALARLQKAQPGGPQLHYVLAQHAAGFRSTPAQTRPTRCWSCVPVSTAAAARRTICGLLARAQVCDDR